MTNSMRDLYGRWAEHQAGNAGGAAAADPRAADWGDTNSVLMKHNSVSPGTPGQIGGSGAMPEPPDFSSAFRAMGYSAGEGPGDHQVHTPEGPAQHGKDVPGEGVPGPEAGAEAGAEGAAGGAAGGAAAGGAAELGEVALLAL